MKIFYSWQSDLPTPSHRDLIRNALDRAIAAVSEDLGLEEAERPQRDEATTGVAGMVDIAATILSKIGMCSALVADITPVCIAPNGKHLPNANVIFELGYAYAKPGQSAIIAVMNAASYQPEDLPFDLRGKRVMTYSLAENATQNERDAALKGLAKDLGRALRVILSEVVEMRAVAAEISGVQPDHRYRSLWTGTKRFSLSNHITNDDVVVVPATDKWAYLRIIPAAWDVPSIAEVEKQSNEVWPSTAGSSSAGNWGAVDFGFVKVWYGQKHPNESHFASAVAAFHEKAGEWWFIDCASVFQRDNVTFLNPLRAVTEWQRYIRIANAALDRLGAPRLRRIIAGVEGVQEALWPGMQNRKYRHASMQHSAQMIDWTAVEASAFLKDAYNKLRNGFALEPIDQQQFDALLERPV